MSDNNKDEAVASFRAITSADEERAKFYMESSNYNLETALTNYYDDHEHEPRDASDIADDPPAARSQSSQPSHSAPGFQSTSNPKKPPKKSVIKSTGNVRTLSSLQNQEPDSDSSDEEEGQAFYAGGSEHSGQQIIGPPRRRRTDLVTDMFRSAREFGAEVVESRPSNSRGGPSRVFSGTGYKLGETGNDSEVIAAKKSEDQSQVEITLKFWKNGFSFNDGPLRSYDDPKSSDFLHHIKHGEVPSELLAEAQGREISFNMEDYRNAEYINTGSKIASFAGTGQKLGSVTPTLTTEPAAATATASASASDTASKSDSEVPPNPIKVDTDKPTTSIQIRLADGSRLVGNFNHHHTIGDIRLFINASSPQSRDRGYTLLSSFPRKELVNNDDTIEQSGLINSVVMQHMIT